MTVEEAIQNRKSIRKYVAERPTKEQLVQILEAGRMAPSACNNQPWRFVCITNADKLAEITKAYDREWIKAAPAIIVVIADHAKSWHRPADGKDLAAVDAAIAIDHMTLRAAEIGLGTCWVCNFDAQIARAVIAMSDTEEPIALLPVGVPTPEAAAKSHPERKSAEEVWTFEE